ncbi:MAG: hypothetical protein IT379_31245 [Deltaproteobacteria bacterium]|nr:hypothetical protein [Deltaproteobacteria bacterium]
MRSHIMLGAWLPVAVLAACTHGSSPLDPGPDAGFGWFIPESAFGEFIPTGSLTIPPIHSDSPPPELGCECEPMQCHRPACDGEMCDPVALDDDSPCLDGGICVGGECLQIESCETEMAGAPFVVASSAFVEANGAGPSTGAAADQNSRVLVIWTAVEGLEIVLYGRRFLADGTPVDCSDAPIEIVRVAALGWDLEPAVAGLASGWVVTWTAPNGDGDLGGIAVQHVTVGGRLLTPARQANRQPYFHQHGPAIASFDEGYVIAWTDDSGLDLDDENIGVRARRFDSEGAALDEEDILVPARRTGDQLDATVAVSGETWLVAWTDAPWDLDELPSLRARRYLGSAAIDLDDDLELAAGFAAGAAATRLGGGSFMVAWESRAEDGRGDVIARNVPVGEGMLVGPNSVAVDPSLAELRPAIAPVGDGIAVTVEVGQSEDDRRRDVSLTALDATLPMEADELAELLGGESLQRGASMLTNDDALWVVWSDDATQWGDMMDPVEGDPAAYRSVLLYRLQLGGGP